MQQVFKIFGFLIPTIKTGLGELSAIQMPFVSFATKSIVSVQWEKVPSNRMPKESYTCLEYQIKVLPPSSQEAKKVTVLTNPHRVLTNPHPVL